MEILPIDLQRRGQELKSCMSSEVLGNLLAPTVEENGVKNDLPMWGHVMEGRVSHVTEILLSLVSVNGVIFSINPHWYLRDRRLGQTHMCM